MATVVEQDVPHQQAASLRRGNAVMAVLHAGQAAAILALANGFALPVTATYMLGPPGADVPTETVTLLELPTAVGVAVFLLVSAVAHALIATALFERYLGHLARSRNPYRWVEYAISASVMIVLIAQLTGISDVAALVALFGVNASMILFGWLVEHYERPGRTDWLPFVFGCFAGAFPWAAIGIMLASPGSSAEAPVFVYAIFVSIFAFFMSFAVNQWLQYRRVGRWSDYLFGERVYVLLSLTAKSALAWQVFGGTLAG